MSIRPCMRYQFIGSLQAVTALYFMNFHMEFLLKKSLHYHEYKLFIVSNIVTKKDGTSHFRVGSNLKV